MLLLQDLVFGYKVENHDVYHKVGSEYDKHHLVEEEGGGGGEGEREREKRKSRLFFFLFPPL